MTHLGPSLRRAKVRERPARRAIASLVTSLLLNAAGLLLLARAGAFRLAPSPLEVEPFSLVPISAGEWAANRTVRPDGKRAPASPAPPAKPEEPPDERERGGQVVDVAPAPDSRRPKDSRFVSDRDNTVERETRSRHAKAGYARTLPVPSAPTAETAPPSGEGGTAERAVPGREGPAPAPPRPVDAPKLALAPGIEGDLTVGGATAHEAPPPAPGAGEGGERPRGEPGARSLITPGTLARIAGGPAPDHLEGVEEGEGTYLNTRGWKYATYFNRIKQAVAATWDPMTPLQARDPDRTMFGYKDRFTLLGVTLDDRGHLKSLVVEQTSGVEFLDRAALTAFRSAEPFMNPPRGIVDANGEIRFSFGFFVELGRAGLRVYRAPMPGFP